MNNDNGIEDMLYEYSRDKETEDEQDYLEGNNMCECGGELGEVFAGDEVAKKCKDCGSLNQIN